MFPVGAPASACLVLSLALALQAAPARAQLADDFIIDYSDLDRYDAALDAVVAGKDAHEVFLDYYSGGGAGLRIWMGIVRTTPERAAERMARRVVDHPDWARIAYGMRQRLEPHEPELRRHYAALRRLYPDPFGPILPTYFVVGTLGGSGSVRPTGSVITLGPFRPRPGKDLFDIQPGQPITDYVDPRFDPGRVLQTALHEMVHYYQLLNQGREGYISMYLNPAEDTLLARAVREGGADYLTELASGLTPGAPDDTGSRHGYLRAHEQDVWSLFRKVMQQRDAEHPGWFSGTDPEHPELPFQIGYSMGHALVAAYHRRSDDRDAAVLAILDANTPAEFAPMVQAYEAERAQAATREKPVRE